MSNHKLYNETCRNYRVVCYVIPIQLLVYSEKYVSMNFLDSGQRIWICAPEQPYWWLYPDSEWLLLCYLEGYIKKRYFSYCFNPYEKRNILLITVFNIFIRPWTIRYLDLRLQPTLFEIITPVLCKKHNTLLSIWETGFYSSLTHFHLRICGD